jgi:hypothetical protein
MFSAVSVLGVVAGAAIARLSERFPERAAMLETIAGILLIAGCAAIGCALPVIV